MNTADLANKLSSLLSLSLPPIALAFVESPPAGVDVFDEQVPSACTLWRRAETQTFYAPAEAHYNCPVGAMTMGFDMPDAVREQLMAFAQKMCGCEYIAPEEVEKIPSVSKPKRGIVYGPLGSFAAEPDLILLWLTPRQAMLYGEAVGSSRWTESGTGVFGRPACAALPVALNSSHATSSFGCMGMRTFTEIDDDRLLVALPGAQADTFVASLEAVTAANATMRSFYETHKAAFTA